MAQEKLTLPKPSSNTPSSATPAGAPTTTPQKEPATPTAQVTGPIKTDSQAIKSIASTQDTANELKSFAAIDRKAGMDERSKMEIATEIYKRMMQTNGMTRKEVLEEFVAQAKLSKAGASTYFQLIKAKG